MDSREETESVRTLGMKTWIEFDHVWTKVLENLAEDEAHASYWQEVYDAMGRVVPSLQKLVGQESFEAYLEECHE